MKSERAWGEGRTNRWTNRRTKVPCVLQDFAPLRPLPCFPSLQFAIMQSRATGIADHTLPLGDLLFFPFVLPRSYNHSSLPKQRQIVAMPFDPREPGIDFTASAFLRLQQTQSPIQSKTSLSRSTTSLQEPRSSGKSAYENALWLPSALLSIEMVNL